MGEGTRTWAACVQYSSGFVLLASCLETIVFEYTGRATVNKPHIMVVGWSASHKRFLLILNARGLLFWGQNLSPVLTPHGRIHRKTQLVDGLSSSCSSLSIQGIFNSWECCSPPPAPESQSIGASVEPAYFHTILLRILSQIFRTETSSRNFMKSCGLQLKQFLNTNFGFSYKPNVQVPSLVLV